MLWCSVRGNNTIWLQKKAFIFYFYLIVRYEPIFLNSFTVKSQCITIITVILYDFTIYFNYIFFKLDFSAGYYQIYSVFILCTYTAQEIGKNTKIQSYLMLIVWLLLLLAFQIQFLAVLWSLDLSPWSSMNKLQMLLLSSSSIWLLWLWREYWRIWKKLKH